MDQQNWTFDETHHNFEAATQRAAQDEQVAAPETFYVALKLALARLDEARVADYTTALTG
jgi:hypothetical protein